VAAILFQHTQMLLHPAPKHTMAAEERAEQAGNEALLALIHTVHARS
jgi:hypothetical protein